VAPSPLGYAPLAPPCYPSTAAYCQGTPTVPVLPQTPQTFLDAYPARVHPHSDGALPPSKRPRVIFGESGRSDRSSSPPIDVLTTVLEHVGMGQRDRKGGPCSLAVGGVISALRCAGPAVDMDVTSKAVDNFSSGCGNAVRLGKGLCAASRMLKGGSPLDAVMPYAASMVATNCCQGHCRAVPLNGGEASDATLSQRPSLPHQVPPGSSRASPISEFATGAPDQRRRGRTPAPGAKVVASTPRSPPHESSLPTADVSLSLGFGLQRPGRRASPPRLGDQARVGVVAPPRPRLHELSLDRLSDHETTPVTSSGLQRRAVFSFRLMDTLTAWLSRETADRRQRTMLDLPSWIGTDRNEGRAVELLCSSVRSRRDSRVPRWFSASLLVASVYHGVRWFAIIFVGLAQGMPMLCLENNADEQRNKFSWSSSVRVRDPTGRSSDRAVNACVSYLFRVLSAAKRRCFDERSDASEGARVIERSLRRYLTVSRMRQPDGPDEDGACLLLSRLCFLMCSTLPHASKLLHSAIDTDWTGAVNTSSVASSFLHQVQAARTASSIEKRRHGADARCFLLLGGPWQAGEARSPSASLQRDIPPVRGPVSPNLAVDPASVNSRAGDEALKSRRGSTASLSSRPAAARDSSAGDALLRLGARLKRLQPASEARQRDTGKASLVNSDERRERGTSRGASASAAVTAVRKSGDVTRRRPSPGPAEPLRDGRSGRGMSCQ